MSVGTVKWFNATKGYGFIVPEDGTKDVFVHVRALEKSGLQRLLMMEMHMPPVGGHFGVKKMMALLLP